MFKYIIGLVLYFNFVMAQAVELNGDFTQGGVLLGRAQPDAKIFFGERQLRLSKDGDFLLGFGRNASLQSELIVELPDGSRKVHPIELVERSYKEQRIDGLPANKVNPTKAELDRIWKEKALLSDSRKIDNDRTDFLKGFIWPVIGRISGVYGSRRILNGTPKRPHYGVDVAAPNGTPIKAPSDGLVTLVHEDMFFTGGTIVVDHGHGLSSTFIHLSRVLVEKGDRLRQGDIIAEVGATGRATGPHLHWAMNWFKTPLDPQLLVEPMPSR